MVFIGAIISSLTLVKVQNGYRPSYYAGCSHFLFGNDLFYSALFSCKGYIRLSGFILFLYRLVVFHHPVECLVFLVPRYMHLFRLQMHLAIICNDSYCYCHHTTSLYSMYVLFVQISIPAGNSFFLNQANYRLRKINDITL